MSPSSPRVSERHLIGIPCSGRASSIAIILFGSLYYTWVKHVESMAPSEREYERVPLDDVETGKQVKPE